MKYHELTTRTQNVLNNANWSNKKVARKLFLEGKFTPHSTAHYRRTGHYSVRGCGWKTYCEIAEWLELPKPIRNKPEEKTIRIPVLCPHCGKDLRTAK